ncbi:MAG: DNA-3-methyladenine glycosylase 2 family protein [Clostridia bacterium]|nr:DNA-3-methyladenine glycosylase 2 family protein [Clostridia bacterium]
MEKITTSKNFFSIKDTLECGQIFRFLEYEKGYKVYSLDKCAYAYEEGDFAVIECKKEDREYFIKFFDLDKDYSKIYEGAVNSGYEILRTSAELGKGIRILIQKEFETLISFMISQNNNIPRIKSTIEKLCKSLGEKRSFLGEYYAFPSVEKLASAPLEFYREVGLGYRAEYVKDVAILIRDGFNLEKLKTLDTCSLKKELLKIRGIGEKVANCILLFGYNRIDSFPVDTWIEKVYRENFFGKEKDINKITKFFLELFKENSGYYQQYLFYYKRSLEKK